MTIYRYQGRWVASEKLTLERRALHRMLAEALAGMLEAQRGERIGIATWTHEESDSVIHLCCIPRTKA